MTATPIPRSLALVLYAGLELTVIAEKPPGRVPSTTKMVSRRSRSVVLRQIERALEAGGRAFVVCPAISESEDLVTVERTFEELCGHLGEARIGRVHGRLSSDARREAMRAFANGETEVLVGTTVLEVGVTFTFAVEQMIDTVRVGDFLHGVIKSLFFGGIIAILACWRGMGTRGGTEGVGRATTETVVYTSVSILCADFILTRLLTAVYM